MATPLRAIALRLTERKLWRKTGETVQADEPTGPLCPWLRADKNRLEKNSVYPPHLFEAVVAHESTMVFGRDLVVP